MFRFLIPVAALVACEPSGMGPIGYDDEPVVERCDAVVSRTFPSDGAVDAYYRGTVEFHLSEADPLATVTATFPGTVEVRDEGRVIAYTPDAPLAPSTAYEATLDYCGGTPTIGFTTSVLGAPLESVDLVGRTFRIGLMDARFDGAPGLAEVAATLLARALLVEVVALDETGVSLRVALGDDDAAAQHPCMGTIDLPAADFSMAPYFTLQATDVSFGSSGTTVDLASFAFTGTLSPDATWMGGGTFRAVLDARDVASLLDTSADGLCSVAAGLGIPCGECADAEPMCVTIDADQIVGEWLDGVSVESIEDPTILPDCD